MGFVAAERVEVVDISGTKKLLVAFAIYAATGGAGLDNVKRAEISLRDVGDAGAVRVRTWSWSRKQEREDREIATISN